MYLLGLDLGTQGARALIVDLDGRVRAEAERAFDPRPSADLPPGYFEQDPARWRAAVFAVLAEAVARLRNAGESPAEIAALSVTSTSGTLCLVDAAGEPVGPAIMYSDTRAGSEAEAVQAAGAELAARLSLGFNASFGLCKAVWVARHEPERLARARWLLSPTDVVIGWLSGAWGVSRLDQHAQDRLRRRTPGLAGLYRRRPGPADGASCRRSWPPARSSAGQRRHRRCHGPLSQHLRGGRRHRRHRLTTGQRRRGTRRLEQHPGHHPGAQGRQHRSAA